MTTDRTIKVGVQLHPQHTTVAALRDAWQTFDALGVDSLWTWDHFYPLYGEPNGAHFEGMSLLAAMAATTSHATLGLMVTCARYRNPDLLADMIRTVDHLSDGRAILGIGSGWFERDFDEYGYEFGTGRGRLDQLEIDVDRITARLGALNPPAVGPLPLLIGGSGEKVTLRIVAERADMWNTFGPPENFAAKSSVLDEWCDRIGRDRSAIERTVCIAPGEVDLERPGELIEQYAQVGAQHLIIMLGDPFETSAVEALVGAAHP